MSWCYQKVVLKLGGEGGVLSWSLLIIETIPAEVTLSPGAIGLLSHRMEP